MLFPCFFSFFSLCTDRHSSVVQYTVDSPCTHIWIETGVESIVFSETSAVILSSGLHTLSSPFHSFFHLFLPFPSSFPLCFHTFPSSLFLRFTLFFPISPQSHVQMKILTNLGAAQVAKTTFDARGFQTKAFAKMKGFKGDEKAWLDWRYTSSVLKLKGVSIKRLRFWIGLRTCMINRFPSRTSTGLLQRRTG